MDGLVYVALVFGLMGVFAFCSQSELKKRIKRLEDELASTKGSSYALSKESLANFAKENIGQQVRISFKEDCWDSDVISYGNTKGKNVILDADENWILVEITTPKKILQKLFRIDSIDGLTLVKG
ncbi:MAG: hypothetical protein J6Y58_08235 [Clostridiales bacterium]|nr:hypothetical protein [Clostridiales bacterium]